MAEKEESKAKLDLKPKFISSKPVFEGKKVIAKHTVGGGDTLSKIALEYYGHASKPYWMLIYESNKDLIGDNPNKVKRGITLKIPELPEELQED